MSSSISPISELPARSAPWLRLARAALLRNLSRLEHGELHLIDADGDYRFGHKSAACALSATVRVASGQFYADTVLAGSVGAGEAYINGHWTCDDLTALVRILVLNRNTLSALETGIARLSGPLRKLFHALHRNSRDGSARNIAAHYDLGNDFYRLMLDETMAYSCGMFEHEHSTLLEASQTKFEAACRKLALGCSDHLLEIGSGWGGLAIYAAQRFGCRVTTTTISRAQHEYASERVVAAGLQDRVTVLLEDYRDLKGHYDKLVSIEMIEAVGASYLDTYFRQCDRLLDSKGAMLLQAITIQDQIYEEVLRSVDYIQRYIFPGSFIPSITALSAAICRASELKIFHLEDIGPHYVRTLAQWRRRFSDNLPQVRRLGYPESFVRLWEFYLCYCEGAFAERQLGDVQMLLTKPRCRRAPIASARALSHADE
ncbi:MAG: cyclopropane-fatty-acyl-phospholipid synthase family protein [Steroidobacteraceae bacterium]